MHTSGVVRETPAAPRLAPCLTLLAAAVALSAAATGGSTPAPAEVVLRLRVSPAETAPARRFELTAAAPAEVSALRVELAGSEVTRLDRRPFATTLRLPDLGRPHWLIVVALDAEGREIGWEGRYLRSPEDRPAAHLRPTADGGLAVLIEATRGDHVVAVELVDSTRTLARRTRPPWRFRDEEMATAGEPAGAPPGVRIWFERGSPLELWQLPAEVGESIDVRLGQARLIVPAETVKPSREIVRALWRSREQRVLRVVGGPDESLEIGLLVDVSTSTASHFEAFRRAATRSAATVAGPSDRLFVAEFAGTSRLLASGRGRVAEVLGALPAAGGQGASAVSPAVAWALSQFHGDDARAALLVVSDGCETTPRTSIGRFVPLARERGIPVHLLRQSGDCPVPASRSPGTVTPPRVLAQQQRDDLERAVRATGGEVHVFTDEAALEARLDGLVAALRRQWLVVFEPESDAVDSRDVRVELRH